ncbi:MAG: hypothetical protein ABI702_12245 [Burkholderiales bacterium]
MPSRSNLSDFESRPLTNRSGALNTLSNGLRLDGGPGCAVVADGAAAVGAPGREARRLAFDFAPGLRVSDQALDRITVVAGAADCFDLDAFFMGADGLQLDTSPVSPRAGARARRLAPKAFLA